MTSVSVPPCAKRSEGHGASATGIPESQGSLGRRSRRKLKLLNDQEKSYQEQKEEENTRKIINLKEELTKLKTFALLVIDEQQHVSEQLVQQTAKVRELQTAAREAQEELSSVQSRAQKVESKVLHLQAELHDQAVQFHQEKEAMSTKLADENSQNRHLHQKLSTLCQEMDELEKTNKALRRAEEELQELRDKKSKGEIGNSSLVSEVEELRKRVVEMEGKDEELIKMENLCRDLNRKLERESIQNRSLKAEAEQDKVTLVTEKLIEESKKALKIKVDMEEKISITTKESEELKVKLKTEEEKSNALQSKCFLGDYHQEEPPLSGAGGNSPPLPQDLEPLGLAPWRTSSKNPGLPIEVMETLYTLYIKHISLAVLFL
ncbi:hypothetical protein QTP86_034149 [Hemibagrus guttatus]|nr:hypothetical protein QTP86_034149 [Hemibagrus guttatus]